MSAAMLLRHGPDQLHAVAKIDGAVAWTLKGTPTRNIGGRASTQEFTDAVLRALGRVAVV